MFALRLKELREKAGLSQAAFADKLNISQSTVGMWESGKREPNFKMTQYIADFFNTTTDYLLGRENLASEKKSELDDYLEELRTRPEMKMLFNVTKNASKEDLEKAVKILETMLGK